MKNIVVNWYICTKCADQGYVTPGKIPNPWSNRGCSCMCNPKITGPHNWVPLPDYQNCTSKEDSYNDISK